MPLMSIKQERRNKILADFEACVMDMPVLAPNKRPELFLIPAETMQAVSVQEIKATFEDMQEMGIAHLPYPVVDLGVPADYFIRAEDNDGNTVVDDPLFKGWQLRYRLEDDNETVSSYSPWLISPSGRCFDFLKLSSLHTLKSDIVDHEATLKNLASMLCGVLVVLLATKNVERERVKNKSLGMGIGKKNGMRPLYTTTIRVPTKLEAHPESGSGVSLRPHLRRGHIRRQKYGPQLCFEKVIWIEPVFVNCDESFISSRTAYNTSIQLNGV